MIENLHSRDFLDHLHTMFSIASPAGPVALELIEVTEDGASPQWEQFSLIFRGPMTPVLPQRTHRLEHDALGSLDIFLVPIGPDGSGMRYEAVFNRLRPES